MKKVLFIDRDGTLIKEPADEQVDGLEKVKFVPGVFTYLGKIARELDYELVMVTNQDGLGTDSFPEDTFWPAHNFILETLEQEGIVFKETFIDRSFPADKSPNRKPEVGMLPAYIYGDYNLAESAVIGDRASDFGLAKNLGSKFYCIQGRLNPSNLPIFTWKEIYLDLKNGSRRAQVNRKTKETDITCSLDLNGNGKSDIQTGLKFFDHMLEQIAKHGQVDLNLKIAGDLEVDEHHSIEDAALVLGQAFKEALGSKKGIERYGYCLPMDDCLAQVALDFGGRPWLVWEVDFKREYTGDVPTEMWSHFFKSFTDAAGANLNIQAEGKNEHHKIESIFKAFAKSIKQAKTQDENFEIPSTKGSL